MPCSGLAPEAIAKAIARGKAPTPPTTPATILRAHWPRLNKPNHAAPPTATTAPPPEVLNVHIVILQHTSNTSDMRSQRRLTQEPGRAPRGERGWRDG